MRNLSAFEAANYPEPERAGLDQGAHDAHLEELVTTYTRLLRRTCPYLAACWLRASAKYRQMLGSPLEDFPRAEAGTAERTSARKSKDQALSSVLFLILLREELERLKGGEHREGAALVEAAYLPKAGKTHLEPFKDFRLPDSLLARQTEGLGAHATAKMLKRTTRVILEGWWTHFDASRSDFTRTAHATLAHATFRSTAYDVMRLDDLAKERKEPDFMRWRGECPDSERKQRGRRPKPPQAPRSLPPDEATLKSYVAGTLDEPAEREVSRYLVLYATDSDVSGFERLASPSAPLLERVHAAASKLERHLRDLVTEFVAMNDAPVPALLGAEPSLGGNDEVRFEVAPAGPDEHVAVFLRTDDRSLEWERRWQQLDRPAPVLRLGLDDEDVVDVVIAVIRDAPPIDDDPAEALSRALDRPGVRVHVRRVKRRRDA